MIQVKRLGRAAAVALSVAAAIGLSGCPALLVPGLAVEGIYEAYKYNKSRSESSQPGPGQSQSDTGENKSHKKKHKALRKRPHPSAQRNMSGGGYCMRERNTVKALGRPRASTSLVAWHGRLPA